MLATGDCSEPLQQWLLDAFGVARANLHSATATASPPQSSHGSDADADADAGDGARRPQRKKGRQAGEAAAAAAAPRACFFPRLTIHWNRDTTLADVPPTGVAIGPGSGVRIESPLLLLPQLQTREEADADANGAAAAPTAAAAHSPAPSTSTRLLHSKATRASTRSSASESATPHPPSAVVTLSRSGRDEFLQQAPPLSVARLGITFPVTRYSDLTTTVEYTWPGQLQPDEGEEGEEEDEPSDSSVRIRLPLPLPASLTSGAADAAAGGVTVRLTISLLMQLIAEFYTVSEMGGKKQGRKARWAARARRALFCVRPPFAALIALFLTVFCSLFALCVSLSICYCVCMCSQSVFSPPEWSRVVDDVKDELDADDLVRAHVCPPPPRPAVDATATPVFECKWSDEQVTQMLRHFRLDESGSYEEKLFRMVEQDVCINENSLTDSVRRYAPALGPALCVPYTATDPGPLEIRVRGWPLATLERTALRLWRDFPLSAAERPALFDLPSVRGSIDRTASDMGYFMSPQLAPIVLHRFLQLRTMEQIATFINSEGDEETVAAAATAAPSNPKRGGKRDRGGAAAASSSSSSSASAESPSGGGPFPPCQRLLLMGGRTWVEGFEVLRAAWRAAPTNAQKQGGAVRLPVVDLQLELMLGS